MNAQDRTLRGRYKMLPHAADGFFADDREYKVHTKPWSGVLSTAGQLVFGSTGGWIDREKTQMESYFFALDADTGRELWRIDLGGTMSSNPISFEAARKQMIACQPAAAFAFSLP